MINNKDTYDTTILNVDYMSNNSVISYIYTTLNNTVDDKRSGYTHHSYLKAQIIRKCIISLGGLPPRTTNSM